MTQWVPLYESSPDVVKSEVATFFDVFPDGTIWSNDINGKGYDVVLAGHATPQTIDVDSMQRAARRDRSTRASRESLREVGFYVGARRCSRPTRARRAISRRGSPDAQINRDSNLRLQYLAGFGLNTYENAAHLSTDASLSQVPGQPVRRRRPRARAVATALIEAPREEP